MKVLLSAYACEPGKGSEPGVGWHWAHEIAALGHEVWVLTRANNRGVIERARDDGEPRGLHFIYYDLPPWLGWWKAGARGVRLYYYLWQIGAYWLAKSEHRRIGFDLVHHITFGVIRHPSFMGRLGIPFVLGPLGGGERAPARLRQSFPLKGRFLEAVREVGTRLAFIDPALRDCYARAAAVYLKTPQSRDSLPASVRPKSHIQLEIGIEPGEVADEASRAHRAGDRFDVLFVGRLVHWKGAHLALAAFAGLVAERPSARLTIVGKGPERPRLTQQARALGVAERVRWINRLPQDEMLSFYRGQDLFLFPSLHDSSGNVVLEALAAGLPVVCLDIGGPAEIVDAACARVISTGSADADTVVRKLAATMGELAADPECWRELADGALERARHMSWAAQVASVYESPVIQSLSKAAADSPAWEDA